MPSKSPRPPSKKTASRKYNKSQANKIKPKTKKKWATGTKSKKTWYPKKEQKASTWKKKRQQSTGKAHPKSRPTPLEKRAAKVTKKVNKNYKKSRKLKA